MLYECEPLDRFRHLYVNTNTNFNPRKLVSTSPFDVVLSNTSALAGFDTCPETFTLTPIQEKSYLCHHFV